MVAGSSGVKSNNERLRRLVLSSITGPESAGLPGSWYVCPVEFTDWPAREGQAGAVNFP